MENYTHMLKIWVLVKEEGKSEEEIREKYTRKFKWLLGDQLENIEVEKI